MASKKQRTNYFTTLRENVGYAQQALSFLKTLLADYDPKEDVLLVKMEQLHEIEHKADMAKHVMTEQLAREFITPIEREDIMALSIAIDDITDSIEDVLQKLYMFHIQEIRPEAIEFVDILELCLNKLAVIFDEFAHFKKSEIIHDEIIALNRLEEDGDTLYLRAMRRLFEQTSEPLTTIVWSRLYDQFERCCDTCELTANLIEEVIMKNS